VNTNPDKFLQDFKLQQQKLDAESAGFFQSIAIPLAKNGLKVIPVRGKIAFINDHPAEATTDIDKITNHWKQFADCNAAIMCVQEPGGTVILDDDGKADLAALYTAETGKPAPQTRRIVNRDTTPGQPFRSHWLFRQTNDTMALPNNIVESTTNGEFSVRVKNFYAVAEGSLHPDHGGIYRAVSDVPIVPMPNDFLEWLLRRSNANKKPIDVMSSDRIARGTHDVVLTSIAGKLRHDGLEENSLRDALIEICEKRCDDYGTDYKLMCSKIAASVCKYPVNDEGVPFFGSQVAIANQWRLNFKTVKELEEGEVRMLIAGFLPEGTTFVGGLPGEGKSLLALSISKALTTGRPFLGRFVVPSIVPVLYLIPESGGRAFRKRCERFGIPDDSNLFLCRTVSEGATLALDDPSILEAVRKLKPVVILDTLIRFSESDDESDSMQNKKLVDDVIALRQAGAIGVIGIHHATKIMRTQGMTLEAALRGTGDIAACADAVYGLLRDSVLYASGAGPNQIDVACLKPRDFDPPLPFRIAATVKSDSDGEIVSVIDAAQDFLIVREGSIESGLDDKLAKLVTECPDINIREIEQATKTGAWVCRKALNRMGWSRKRGGVSSTWTKVN
jgi:hypothetical protein